MVSSMVHYSRGTETWHAQLIMPKPEIPGTLGWWPSHISLSTWDEGLYAGLKKYNITNQAFLTFLEEVVVAHLKDPLHCKGVPGGSL